VIFLKCPGCGAVIPVPLEDAGETILLVEDDEVEDFVREHHPHLEAKDYFCVIESIGDC
jgi:hypothetical protein